MDPWKQAVALTLSEAKIKADLDPKELEYFNNTTKEDLLLDIQQAEQAHQQGSKTRSLSNRMAPFVGCIQQYSKALDVLSNTPAMPVSTIWGGVRILIQLAQSFEKYFDKLISMLERISDVLPRFDLYFRLFPDNQGLVTGLARVYADIVRFCFQARIVFRKELVPRKKGCTSAKTAMKLSWKDFDRQFGDLLERFREHKNHVEEEAKAAAMERGEYHFQNLKTQGETHMSALLEVQRLQKSIKEVYGAFGTTVETAEWNRLLSWLGGGIGNETLLRKSLSLRAAGTGQWLTEHSAFREWSNMDSGSSIIWLNGSAGKGKTLLCSLVVDNISSSVINTLSSDWKTQNMVLYHFCDFRNHASTRTTNILGCLLRQALQYDRNRYIKDTDNEVLQARLHQDEALLGEDFADELERILVSRARRAYIIIDGLDECIDQLNILPRLSNWAAESDVKILVSSRDEPAIRTALGSVPALTLTPELLHDDVESFISAEVNRLVRGNLLKTRDPKLPHVVAQQLSQKSQGMFLWAKLQLEDICRKRTDRAIREAVDGLPTGLIATYQRSTAKLRQLPEDERALIKLLFQWAVFAVQPITTRELSICLMAVDQEAPSIKDDCIITDPEELSALTGGLLASESASDGTTSILVSHRSVQDFLTSDAAGDFRLDQDSTHLHIAKTCLAYLRLDDFSTVCDSWDKMTQRNDDFEFLEYAARYWPAHFHKAPPVDSELLESSYRLLTGPNFLPWLQIYKSHRDVQNHRTFHSNATSLYWAARLELHDIVKRILISKEVDVNEVGGSYGTALHMASYNGDEPMVKLLLEYGADVKNQSGMFNNPLQAAAYVGHKGVVEKLLEAGADPHQRGGLLTTALEAAILGGYTDISNLLLKAGQKHPSHEDKREQLEALAAAIIRKDASTVQQLIDAGADVNVPLQGYGENGKGGDDYPFPLILAISLSSDDVVRSIINAGANVDVSDSYHGSALAFAAYRHRTTVVHALLEAGANPIPDRHTYSGGRVASYISSLDEETRQKMNKGKGLKVWAQNRTLSKEEKNWREEGFISDVIQGNF